MKYLQVHSLSKISKQVSGWRKLFRQIFWRHNDAPKVAGSNRIWLCNRMIPIFCFVEEGFLRKSEVVELKI